MLCDAVEFLHGLGICHGDISPRNVLKGDDLNYKLIDFTESTLHKCPRFPMVRHFILELVSLICDFLLSVLPNGKYQHHVQRLTGYGKRSLRRTFIHVFKLVANIRSLQEL